MSTVQGTVADDFETVRARFVAAEGAGLPAQLASYHHGEQVVDLWSGSGIAGDTLLGVYSASKGVAHLVVALLVQDGLLDLDERVCHYWPEFAVHGKQNLTLRELLAHRSGLVGADGGFTLEELAGDRVVAERLGAQRPFWRPGSAFGYHALVLAALSGEVVRRATGRRPRAPRTACPASRSTGITHRARTSGSCRTSGWSARSAPPRSVRWVRPAAWPGCTRRRPARWTAPHRC